MLEEVFCFYILFFAIIVSAIGIILAPRMFLAMISFFLLICMTSLLYLTLNAGYIALFQFILCGVVLGVYIFLLLKKIGRLNLKLKLVPVLKIISGAFFTVAFGVLCCLFMNEEFENSLYSIFNYITEKSSDIVDFAGHVFPLHLVILLVLISAIVIRVYLINRSEDV